MLGLPRVPLGRGHHPVAIAVARVEAGERGLAELIGADLAVAVRILAPEALGRAGPFGGGDIAVAVPIQRVWISGLARWCSM